MIFFLLTCDGTWHDDPEMPCTGKLPVPLRKGTDWPYRYAHDHGWTRTADGRDLCPAHARMLAEVRS